MMNIRWVISLSCLIFALVSIVCANPYSLYGYEGHIYASYVTFSNDDVITYILDSPSSADYDLIVYDAYDGKGYFSQNDGNVQESVQVPGSWEHVHVIFIDGIRGEGPFNLLTANDSITWDNDAFTDLGVYYSDEEAMDMADLYYEDILDFLSDETF